MARNNRQSVGAALQESPTHAQSVASGFGGPTKSGGRRVSKAARQQADASASAEPTAKATFKMPQSILERFDEVYETLRAEERAEKRRLTKVTFAGLVFQHGLKEEALRKALRVA